MSYQNDFNEWFKTEWEERIGPIAGRNGIRILQKSNSIVIMNDEYTEIIEVTTDYEGDIKAIQTTLDQYVEKSYNEGFTETLKAYGRPIRVPPTAIVEDYITQVSYPLTRDISNDLNKRALRDITAGIRAGESYSDINDRVTETFSKYNKEGIPKTVQKVVHEAFQHARMDELEADGQDQVLWITAGDDKVRPEHQALEGASPITMSLAREHESDWACRCTISPVSILRRVREPTESI
ncbi:phage head morphogenesis protein [Candidatus Dependentiae bacterium]|nr:phage head morphogenesis protein [Candidatus Dependentiae bacterium]